MGALGGKAKALFVGNANLANHANLHESFRPPSNRIRAIRLIRLIRDEHDQRFINEETNAIS
jgi:hypothetical protein